MDTEKQHIINLLIKHLLEHHKPPVSVKHFCDDYLLDETIFFKYFADFNEIEQDIWVGFFTQTMQVLDQDEAYPAFSVREKILSFYYTYFQTLTEQRSYVQYAISKHSFLILAPVVFKKLKKSFMEYMDPLVKEGMETGEFEKRMFLSNYYPDSFWTTLVSLTNSWATDKSKAMEQTDQEIDKAVNFVFDLLGRTPIDSFVDLAGFVIRKKVSEFKK